MAKTTKTPKPKLNDFFKKEEIGPLPDDYAGHWLILSPETIKAEFRTRSNLVWQAQGGFGCDPMKMGRAVFGVCAGDGEDSRWDRGQFVAEFLGDVEALRVTK